MVLGWIARANRRIIRPHLERHAESEIKILRAEDENDAHDIKTDTDIAVSKALLDGAEDIPGLRSLYPASFSEEEDSPRRKDALDLIELDPTDGTGDFVDTYKSARIMSPTTLAARLTRASIHEPFTPVWGIIFEVMHEYALVSDGETVLFLVMDGEHFRTVFLCLNQLRAWQAHDTINLARRASYPHLAYDGPFIRSLGTQGINVRQVLTGGAGMQALQFFRQFIRPSEEKLPVGAQAFIKLEPLSALFAPQGDWKCWDTDATAVIARALRLPNPRSVWGKSTLAGNASNNSLDVMRHAAGYILAGDIGIETMLLNAAWHFNQANPNCSLRETDYRYKDAILAMAK